eukprot:Skav234531  [mRNA]  locus=scaffold2556:151843:157554:- [translate_table: standard]
MGRTSTAAAVELIVHKACEETRRLEATKVFVFNLKVDSLTFEGSALRDLRGLHFAISLHKGKQSGRRILHTPAIKPIVEGSEGHQKCFFNLRYEVDILWEGRGNEEIAERESNSFRYQTWFMSLEKESAQADLWMQGVERLTTEGALDSNTVNIARACGLVSPERAETLRDGSARQQLASRSGSFTLHEHDNTKWLRFCSA